MLGNVRPFLGRGEGPETRPGHGDARRCIGAVDGHLAEPRDMRQSSTRWTLGVCAVGGLIDSDDLSDVTRPPSGGYNGGARNSPLLR